MLRNVNGNFGSEQFKISNIRLFITQQFTHSFNIKELGPQCYSKHSPSIYCLCPKVNTEIVWAASVMVRIYLSARYGCRYGRIDLRTKSPFTIWFFRTIWFIRSNWICNESSATFQKCQANYHDLAIITYVFQMNLIIAVMSFFRADAVRAYFLSKFF